MSTDLSARIDRLEEKLRSAERELAELRALAAAERTEPAAAVGAAVVVAAPTPSPDARLREISAAVKHAESSGDGAALRALAAEAEQLAPFADPAWATFARDLSAYARSVADRVRTAQTTAPVPQAAPATTRPPERSQPAKAAAAEPRPRRKTVSERAAEWDLFGARGLALAGGIVTLLGIVFFFVLATNRGWIGPAARVGLGAAASALVFAAGILIRRRYGQLHAALAACGAGIAGGYATLAAATILYELLPAAGALVAAAGIASAGVVVALAWSSQALAALAFLGAALAPAALALDEGVGAAGTAFAAIVLAALAAAAVRRGWERLLVAGATVTVAQVGWMVAAAEPGDGGAVAVTAAVVGILVLAAAAWQLAASQQGLDALTAGLATTAVGLTLGAALHLYPDEADQAVALFTVAAGFAVACALLARPARELAWALGAGGLVLGGVATADAVSGSSIGVVWAAQSLLASLLAFRLRERRFTLAALTYLGLVTFEAFGPSIVETSDGSRLEFDPAVASLLAAALASLGAGVLAPADAVPAVREGVLRLLAPLQEWLGTARIELRAGLAWLAFAQLALAASEVLDGVWLAVTYAAGSAVLAVAAWRLGELRLVPFELAAGALAAAHALSVDARLIPDLHPELSAGLTGAAATAAAAGAWAVAAALLPAAQRGIRRLGQLAGPEPALEAFVASRSAVRAFLAGVAVLLGLGAAGLVLVDLLGDVGHVVTVVLWSTAGLAAVALGARHSRWSAAWAGAGLLAATLIKVAGYDWSQLGSDQGASELLVCAAAILAAGWLVRALSTSGAPIGAASAVASGVALVSTISALAQLVPSERPAGALLLGVAAVFGALAAAAQREPRLRNLSTAMWIPGLVALCFGETLLLQDRNIAVAYAVTSVALAGLARAIREARLLIASLAVLGGTTAVVLVALTPPSRLLDASEHPGSSGWTIAACAVAWAVLAALEPRLRERLGWLAAALGLYTVSLLILEIAERVSTASVQTDFERGHTAVSALWGAVGLGLLVAGLLRDSRMLRLGGLALFGISLAKLFLYDLSTLSSITRAFSFLAVGALLLAGGFFLQRLSRRLEDAQPPQASEL
jgi:uncharacterized membrane protein